MSWKQLQQNRKNTHLIHDARAQFMVASVDENTRTLGKALGVDANARKDAFAPRLKLVQVSQYKPIMLRHTDCMYSIC